MGAPTSCVHLHNWGTFLFSLSRGIVSLPVRVYDFGGGARGKCDTFSGAGRWPQPAQKFWAQQSVIKAHSRDDLSRMYDQVTSFPQRDTTYYKI